MSNRKKCGESDIKTDVCTFEFLQKNIDAVKLPSNKWVYSKGNTLFFGFQRVENNGYVRKRVAVLPKYEIQIYVDDELIPFSEYIRVMNIDELGSILEKVDKYP